MTHLDTTTQTGTTTLGDRGASILRTAVPSLWGTVVAAILGWALPLLPGDVGQALADLLGSDVVLSLLVVASIAAWYAIARWLEPRLPDVLTRIVLGSAAAPTYPKVAEVTDDGAAVITTLTDPATTDAIPAAVPEQIVAGQDPSLDYADVHPDSTATTA